jgi:hypothetical protein
MERFHQHVETDTDTDMRVWREWRQAGLVLDEPRAFSRIAILVSTILMSIGVSLWLMR